MTRNAKDIFGRSLSNQEEEMLRRDARLQAKGNNSGISFETIPELTEQQLSQMIKFRDRPKKVAVSVRLDSEILEWLKSKGEGHLTRINDILANVMEAEQRLARK